jgi:hypothetical protein
VLGVLNLDNCVLNYSLRGFTVRQGMQVLDLMTQRSLGWAVAELGLIQAFALYKKYRKNYKEMYNKYTFKLILACQLVNSKHLNNLII